MTKTMSEDKFSEDINESYTYLPFIKVDSDGSIFIDGQPSSQDASELSIESAEVLFLPFADELEQKTELSTVINEVDIESSAEIRSNFIHDYDSVSFKDNAIDLSYALYLQSLEKNKYAHVCSICEKAFNNSASLKRHVRIHTGERPYQCQLCDKYFSQQSNLWKHVRTHTGERPFECPHCSKKFSQKANMSKHLVIHTGEKPYACPVCSRSFTQQANLSKHMRLHSGEKPYGCSYCEMRFTQRANLQKHEHLHEGIKPYTCETCCMSFTQQGNLRKHNLMHQHVKRFKCELCSKGYVQKISLSKHQQRCMGGVLDPSKFVFDNENELTAILNSVNIKLETDLFESEG